MGRMMVMLDGNWKMLLENYPPCDAGYKYPAGWIMPRTLFNLVRKVAGDCYDVIAWNDGALRGYRIRYTAIYGTDDFFAPAMMDIVFKSITYFALGRTTIGGTSQLIYEIQRRNAYLYRPDGSTYGLLAPGTRIATDTDTMGSTKTHTLLIRYVYRYNEKGLGSWTPATDAGYGFVSTGIESGYITPDTLTIKTSMAS